MCMDMKLHQNGVMTLKNWGQFKSMMLQRFILLHCHMSERMELGEQNTVCNGNILVNEGL